MNSIKELLLLTVLSVFLIPCLAYGQDNRDKWDIADSLTVRLQPEKFDQLPQNILLYLEEYSYTIPQCGCKPEPHNIISGSFGKEQQSDWAVLASKNKVSRILIFWDGSTNNPSEVAENEDRTFLQSDVDGIVYSRLISPVEKKNIENLHEKYGGETELPPIKHLGIDDAFVWKGSSIHYFYNDQWFELSGTD